MLMNVTKCWTLLLLFWVDLGAPDGIAYDWINRRIYYSDFVNQSINSMSVDGSQRTGVVHVSRPRAIMLDPCRG